MKDWEKAIVEVLAERGEAMSCKEIMESIRCHKYSTDYGVTPEKSVNRYLNRNPNLFKRVSRGRYELIGTSVIAPPAAAKTVGGVAPIVVRPCTSYKPGDSKYKEAKDFVKPPVLSDLEMKLLELIVNFRLPLEMGEVCFADILDKDKLDVKISEEKKLRSQSVDAALLGKKLDELNEYIADIELKLQRNPNHENKYGALLNHMRPAAKKAEKCLQGASDGKVEFKYPLLGEFVPGNKESKPKVIIYYENIKNKFDKSSSEYSLNVMAVMAGVFVHEMFHAWNYFNAGQKPRSVLAIDEPMVEFETLYFLKKLEAFTKSKYHSLKDEVPIVRSNRASRVHNKQQSIGNVAAYGFGYYLFKELSKSDADSIDWIETYYKKSASISSNPLVKDVETALIPVYPFMSENKVMKWFEEIIFSGRATLATTRKSTAAKVGSHVSLYDLVLACIKTIGRKCFEAKELYAFAPIFKVCMPQCENLEDALKHQLDELVKKGVLEAIPGDCYSVNDVKPTTPASAPTKSKGTKAPSIPFAVEFPDDNVRFEEETAVKTFIESLKHIGLNKVQSVGIMRSGCNLVSNDEHPLNIEKKLQHKEDDKYIYIKLGNQDKKGFLYQIANELRINIKIDDI